MKIRLAILMFLLSSGLHAQTVGEWLRPSLSSSIYVTEIYAAQTGKFRTSTLSALSATFGAGTPLQFALAYDVIGGKFMGCEVLWKPRSEFGLRVGIQRMPFLLETTYSPRVLEAIGFSQAASFLGGYSADLTGKNSRSRDCGIAVEGAFLPRDGYSVISYIAGVYNGNGYSFRDDNKAKDFQGRVVIQPSADWKVSLGAMLGRYSVEEDRLGRRNRLTTGVWFDNGRWFLRGENIYGITDALRSDGVFVMGGARFHGNMSLSSRLDHFVTDLSDRTSASTRAQVCFAHFLSASRDFSYRLQYGHTFYADPALDDADQISLCLIFRFGAQL